VLSRGANLFPVIFVSSLLTNFSYSGNVQIKDTEGAASLKDKILNYPVLEEGTYLHLASRLNHGDVVRTLLACGSNPAVLNKEGHSAVEIACSQSKNVQQIYVEELLRAAANSE